MAGRLFGKVKRKRDDKRSLAPVEPTATTEDSGTSQARRKRMGGEATRLTPRSTLLR